GCATAAELAGYERAREPAGSQDFERLDGDLAGSVTLGGAVLQLGADVVCDLRPRDRDVGLVRRRRGQGCAACVGHAMDRTDECTRQIVQNLNFPGAENDPHNRDVQGIDDKDERRQRGYGQYCPISRALDVLGERWSLLILRDMLVGTTRFND